MAEQIWNAQTLKEAGFRRVGGSNGIYVRMMGTQMEVASTRQLGYFKSVDWEEDDVPDRWAWDPDEGYIYDGVEDEEYIDWVNEKSAAIAGDKNIKWRHA